MTNEPTSTLRIGEWRLDPATGEISRGRHVVRLEARTLRLLLDLAEHRGEVVSIDELLERVWAGVIVTPDSVYQAIAALRRLLGDDPRRPRYIATVPRLGYRMVAQVGPWMEPGEASLRKPSRRPFLVGGGAALALTLSAAGYYVVALRPRTPSATVGVLPFLDMTPSMDQEILADDVTEGLIDKLSHEANLRTPGFRASFLLKGKHLTPAQAARTLGVAFVIDGTVRKAGERVRIAARLVRAADGFVVWSQAYDRPLTDIATAQDAIATGVAGAVAGRTA